MRVSTQTIGLNAETQATQYLEQHGLTVIEKNYRGRMGEIDLIMRDHDYTVFIEVRFRHDPNFGNSLETIGPNKKNRIIKTALYYLQEINGVHSTNCRFDCIGIDSQQNIIWIKNAFDANY